MLSTFSNFPSARASIALLLLRVVVGASAILEASLTIAHNQAPALGATLAGAFVMVAGLALIIGLLTPIASILICMAGAVMLLLRIPTTALLLFDSRMAHFEFVVESAMLLLLGPGAISVDARLFGRKEVLIQRGPRPNDS